MIDHTAIQLDLRTKLLTLSVATTGSASLAATTTGYTRTAGSFITDGFKVGMEVTATGFTNSKNNTAKTVTGVAGETLTCAGNVAEAATTVTLTAGLPALQLWENIPLTAIVGRPYVAEQYLPGPMRQDTLGPLGGLEVQPVYVVQVYVPENTGIGALGDYGDSILTLFAPGTAMTVGSDTLQVRRDVAPFRGQVIYPAPGWAMTPVSIPCRIRTANSI